MRLFREQQPDVVLMDLRMPELDGIAATRTIRAEFPDARVIALTSYDGDQDIYRALEAGVRGYLLKEMAHTDVVHAIRTVHAGRRLMPPDVAERLSEYFPQVALTPRETEVLELVSEGLGNKRSPTGWARPAAPSRCTSRTFSKSWARPTAPTRSPWPSGAASCISADNIRSRFSFLVARFPFSVRFTFYVLRLTFASARLLTAAPRRPIRRPEPSPDPRRRSCAAAGW